jgi:hypothetical protein
VYSFLGDFNAYTGLEGIHTPQLAMTVNIKLATIKGLGHYASSHKNIYLQEYNVPTSQTV